MALNTSLRKIASTLLGKFGGDVVIRRVTPSAYSTATGAVTESVTDTAIRGVIEGISLREVNDLIQATDKRLTVAALDLSNTVPSPTDRIVIDGVVHQIIAVDRIEQDGLPITYELILRS